MDTFKKAFATIYFNFIGTWAILREQILGRPRELNLLELSDMSGKIAVITGGNRGIGLEAVKKLLSLGCRVVVGCRRPGDARSYLLSKMDEDHRVGDRLECLPLDLTSMASVRKFAAAVLEKESRVDCLINNAGVMFGKKVVTEDGFESQMSTNYLGHFLLTSLLLEKLRRTATLYDSLSRVVNVSSIAHFVGSWMDIKDLNSRLFYSPESAYGNSKAAQIMFTKFLSRKLLEEGCDNVLVNCLHPGVVNTDLYSSDLGAKMIRCLTFWLMKTPEQGSRGLVHAAASLSVDCGGFYFDNLRPARSSSFVNNHANQAELWKATCDLLAIDEFGKN